MTIGMIPRDTANASVNAVPIYGEEEKYTIEIMKPAMKAEYDIAENQKGLVTAFIVIPGMNQSKTERTDKMSNTVASIGPIVLRGSRIYTR